MNRNIVFLLVFILVLISRFIEAQSLKLGFRVEPTILLIEHKYESSISFTPYSLYLSTIFEPVDWLGVEVRPGYLIGGDFWGFEIGFFARFKILPTKFYLITGLNNHSNEIHNAHNSGGSYEKNMLFKSVGLGFQKDSKLSIDLMYYWTNDKDFAYTFEQFESIYSRRINKQMNGIIKVGLSLAWDIL